MGPRVRAAASEWQSDVAREITIQVRPTQGRDLETEVARKLEDSIATLQGVKHLYTDVRDGVFIIRLYSFNALAEMEMQQALREGVLATLFAAGATLDDIHSHCVWLGAG